MTGNGDGDFNKSQNQRPFIEWGAFHLETEQRSYGNEVKGPCFPNTITG
jgi:hypothetical protein